MRPTLLIHTPRAAAVPVVVIVDDDATIRALLERFVVQLGWVAHTAEHAEGALELLHTVRASVVLCDIRMPGFDGAWLIDRILDQWPTLPVVIVSGVSELDPRLTLRPGVAGFVLKPFDVGQLRTALLQAMARPVPVEPEAQRKVKVRFRP